MVYNFSFVFLSLTQTVCIPALWLPGVEPVVLWEWAPGTVGSTAALLSLPALPTPGSLDPFLPHRERNSKLLQSKTIMCV